MVTSPRSCKSQKLLIKLCLLVLLPVLVECSSTASLQHPIDSMDGTSTTKRAGLRHSKGDVSSLPEKSASSPADVASPELLPTTAPSAADGKSLSTESATSPTLATQIAAIQNTARTLIPQGASEAAAEQVLSTKALETLASGKLHPLRSVYPPRCHESPDSAPTFKTMRHIPWNPIHGRYLLPICQYGRLSNQQMCIRYYFWFASLLNRTLIIPRKGFIHGENDAKYWWTWGSILDASSMRRCLSGRTESGLRRQMRQSPPPHVVNLDELLEALDHDCLNLDRVFLFNEADRPHLDEAHRLPGVCPFNGTVDLLEPKKIIFHKVTSNAVEKAREVKDAVVSLGSIFGLNVIGLDIKQNRAPFKLQSGCRDLWQPSPAVLKVVERLVDDFSAGQPFASMHMRRGDFANVYKDKMATMPDIAVSILEWLKPLNATILYLASDASPVELRNLEGLLHQGIPTLKVVHSHGLLLEWKPEIEKVEDSGAGIVLAVIEKYVAAQGVAFLSTHGSTFSGDIQRIREATSLASCWDASLKYVQ